MYKKGIFAGKGKMTNFTSIMFDHNGVGYSGGTNGELYIWKGNALVKTVKVHDSEVHSVFVGDGKIITGGKDFKVCIFNHETLEKEGEIQFTSTPRALDYVDGKIVAGLRNAEIWITDLTGENKQLVNSGHHDGETWGVVQHGDHIYSIGDDNKILKFNYKEKKFVAKGIMAAEAKQTKKHLTASTLSTLAAN